MGMERSTRGPLYIPKGIVLASQIKLLHSLDMGMAHNTRKTRGLYVDG
jgi:hypothetical protein